jgi:hypothetical protein
VEREIALESWELEIRGLKLNVNPWAGSVRRRRAAETRSGPSRGAEQAHGGVGTTKQGCLFGTQGFHHVDLGGAGGWEHRRDESRGEQDDGRAEDSQSIGHAHV